MNQSKEWCFLENIYWSPSMFWMQVVYCKSPEGTFLEMSREFIEMLSCVPLQPRSRDTWFQFILALWSVTLYIQTYICCNGRVKLDNRRHIHIFSSCYTTFSMVLLNWEKTLFLAVLLLAFLISLTSFSSVSCGVSFVCVSLPSLELFVAFAIVWTGHSFSSAPAESCRFVYELSPLPGVYARHWVNSIFVVLYQRSSLVFGYFSWRISSVDSSAENYAYTVKNSNQWICRLNITQPLLFLIHFQINVGHTAENSIWTIKSPENKT